jgi:hypothetical protein
MRKLPRTLLAAIAAGLVCAAGALAITGEFGNTVVSTTASVLPRTLPAHGGAPVTLSATTRIKEKSGAQPSALKSLTFQIDKHGFVETKGFGVCTAAKLEGTTPAQARRKCANALVGEGTGKAAVAMPGQAQFTITSQLSFFNAPPTNGNPTLIAHAYETVPAPKALLVPIVIEKVGHGRYGFQAKVTLPEIAGGFGAATLAEANLGRTVKRGGREVGYINAYCSGGRLQVHGSLSFANGDFFPTTLTSACHTAD